MAIIYVKSGSTGNGSAWNNAYGGLASAITAAQAGDEIWVSAGTYKPTTGTDRTASFTLKNNVGIYGGFAGTETAVNQRNITTNVTILSGEIGVAGIADNSYHVVTGSSTNNTAILDGFTITKGNANGTTGNQGTGGGMYVNNGSPTVRNTVFIDNNATSGGGLYNEQGSNPFLSDVRFEFNTATDGAAIYNRLSSPFITNATFRLNTAVNNGGALYNASSSSPTVTNAVFTRNTATTADGGAVYNISSLPNFTNTDFSGNVAARGGAISNNSSTIGLSNSIIYGNQDRRGTGPEIFNNGGTINTNNSIIKGGVFNGTDVDPKFVNASGDDLRLLAGSPAIDTGNSASLPTDRQDIDADGNTTEATPLDLARNPRIAGSSVDIGAFEGATTPPTATKRIIYVNAAATGGNSGTSWTNAFTDLQAALNAAPLLGDEIWVAAGTYKPTTTTDRTATFTLKNQVKVYGGFAGTETTLEQRNVTNNVTTLSGDIGGTTNAQDNVYHVVTASFTNNTTVLDGFTIAAGNANGTGTDQNNGGGIFINDGTPVLSNLIFDNNNASANGGGLFNTGASNPTLTNVTFRNNNAANGGGIFNTGSSNPTLTNATFTSNNASSQGGAIYNNSSNPTLNTATFTNNTATNSGGAIFNTSSNPTLNNVTFTNNRTTASSGGGGALYNGSSSNPTLNQVSFQQNSSANGGAIFNTSSSPILTDVTFGSNSATNGGAISNNSSYTAGGTNFHLTRVTFTNNSASFQGGAIFNASSNPRMTNITFTGNTTTDPANGGTGSDQGGAIYNTSSNPTINSTTFSQNSANSDGGAIYNYYSSPTLTDITFTNNSSVNGSGGAVYNTYYTTATLTNANFNLNSANNGFGGAIYGSSSSVINLTQNNFQQNSASSGGAIYNSSSSSNLTNVSFSQNAASSNGGAIYSTSSSSTQTNVTFSRNNAISQGGAIWINGSGANTLVNTSFYGNASSSGSAIFNSGTAPTLRNSIIWGHGGTAIVGSPTITNSIVQGGYTGTGNVTVDPLTTPATAIFVDPNFDDLRLKSGSPAIDAGSNTFLPADSRDLDKDGNTTEPLSQDLGNNPRVNGTTVDIGAYEFTPPVNQPPVITNKTFTIAKSSAVGATVGTVPISDPENNPFTVTITNGNTDTDNDGTRPFAISNAGVITVTDPGDFGTNTSFNLTIAASDGSATGTGNAVINLNSPPTVNNATFSIVNNSAVGATVGTVTASDPENNPLTFSITNGNTDTDNDGTRPFAINNSGVITVTDPGDFGTNNSFNLTVTANDGNATGNGAIVVNLTSPVNRPPVVNDAVFSISKTSPNGTVVGTINATDPDNNPLTYSITAGNPDTDGDTIKAFAISNTGVITVTDTNDVSAQTNPFNLTIQASDGALTDTGIATVNLNNVNPLSFQLKLYEDNNGTVGSEITGNNPILGNSFFAEILVGDIRTNAAGLIINSLDFGFAADVAQNINNFADIGNVNSPLVTSSFPLFRGGTLDNTNGLIDNLSGGSVPQASQGSAIGVNQLNRFSLLRFNVVGTRDNSNLNLTFDPSQIGFADGTFADPNGTLSLTRNIIINDAPIVGSINNVNLAERNAAGTVVVAGNLVEATDDNYGQTPTFSLSTSPKDGSGNDLFAINATTGEITLTQAGSNTIDYESGVISYQLGVKATDGYKLSTEKTFNVNITNVNEGTIVVDKNAITFGTKLSQYRQGATDSLFVRPNFADRTQYIDITNTAVGTNDVLAIAGITVNAQNVTTDANFANGDILLNPGQTRRIALAYTPKAARENFNLANGLVINSNAQNNSALNIQLTGKSTFNSDISYDGRVNLTDLNTLQRPGLFGSSSGQTNYDPTADITGDGRINLSELVPLNSEFGLVI
ncbi:Alkaline phosphatase [Microcystis aeruginosa NIES-2549]|uniref:Alkaline phosphatase n=1 Tax=Microcystis aeruginosa NIES-2549 TaxID=1641812 RepID=A0A0F6RKB4_MICAE|nr:cadherin repeat domain-containing protein [Microcystis aeruginosa]AKE63695.1 Alkaline phosphatase [Microcystis aeruginosa NIES-2549]